MPVAPHLPSEIIYEIVAPIIVENIDLLITDRRRVNRKTFIGQNLKNPVTALLRTSVAFRATTQKVLSDALGIALNDDGSLQRNPFRIIRNIRVLWMFCRKGNCRRYTDLAMKLNYKTSRLPAAYVMMAGGEMLVHDRFVPKMQSYDPEKASLLPKEALLYADDISPQILAGPVTRRIESYLWSCYVADEMMECMELLEEVCMPFRNPGFGRKSPGYKNALITTVSILEVVKTCMKQEDNRRYNVEFGPYPGAAKLRADVIMIARGHLAPLRMVIKLRITDQKDRDMIIKATLEAYTAMDGFLQSLFPAKDGEEDISLMDYYVDCALPFNVTQPLDI
ncbi:unnamed protein product [Somion occarium]|uniref:Uncharacterized protein n=1 Tax=Somion occarium TaxID=3059160 RepID=A0ABP1CTS8_9APHY